MPKARQVDGLTPEEIRDIKEFYLTDAGKVHLKTSKEAIKWLHDR